MSVIDFSGQFGGRDAHEALRPHFRLLKAAAKSVVLHGLPWPELAFILRVDGDVNQYGASGPGNVEIDRRGAYVSVDLVITRDDRDHLTASPEDNALVRSIRESVDLLRRSNDPRLARIDYASLGLALRELCERYVEALRDPLAENG